MTDDWIKIFINQERINKAIRRIKNKAAIADYNRRTGQNIKVIKSEEYDRTVPETIHLYKLRTGVQSMLE